MGERRQRFANEKHEYHDPRVQLGCWFEERARRETDYREFVDLFKRGDLPAQKMEQYVESLNAGVKCTDSLDGRLLNGCIVGLSWFCGDAFLSALPKSISGNGQYEKPIMVTGAMRPSTNALPARSAIRIFREDQRIPDNVPLMHNECLVFCLAGSPQQVFLNFDSPDPMPYRKPNWIQCSSSHSLWKASGRHTYIAVNSPVVIHHVSSGYRLTMDDNPIQTVLGVEREVTCTFDQHKPDVWRFVAPCHFYPDSPERQRFDCRSAWDVLHHRY